MGGQRIEGMAATSNVERRDPPGVKAQTSPADSDVLMASGPLVRASATQESKDSWPDLIVRADPLRLS